MSAPPHGRGKMTLILMLLFALGFTVGGYFAVRWVVAHREAAKAGTGKAAGK